MRPNCVPFNHPACRFVLHSLVQRGATDAVRERLRAGDDSLNLPDGWQKTPLMHAVMSPAAEPALVELLLAAGADPNAKGGSATFTPRPVLSLAVSAGAPEKVRLLLDYGADPNYRYDAYDIIIDAMRGRDIAADPRLLELLALLIERGAAPGGADGYGEWGLGTASYEGRFDAVALLLAAGVSPRPLGLTPLLEAIALGDLPAVKARIDAGDDLDARDRWQRTPWLLAVHAGEVKKAALLRARGADLHARGPMGWPALFYAVRAHRHEMLRWLLEAGSDPNVVDEHGGSVLMEAAKVGDLIALDLLLAHGADLHYRSEFGTALGEARERPVIERLLRAGGDPSELRTEANRVLCGFAPRSTQEYLEVTDAQFARGWQRRFGRANPELMDEPFWEAMIRSGEGAWAPGEAFGATPEQHPIWCAERFGQSITQLPDGRIIAIGGEHEDFYDPDFCIYNDVFVFENGRIRIFGYPERLFPPTDFHSATLVGEWIYIIGSVGYSQGQPPEAAPVFRLHTGDFHIEPVACTGAGPGWIHGHRADLIGETIRISGGELVQAGAEELIPNQAVWRLDLRTRVWQRE